MLLFAGHGVWCMIVDDYDDFDSIDCVETTAHTFASTLGMLAVHADIQKEVLEQIFDVVGWDRDPVSNMFSGCPYPVRI